jgi:dihydrodipicolinate synthase/N-acetylneuraminate lyase
MSTSQPDGEPDRLWVPLLTHYRRQGSSVAIDLERTAAHLSFIRPWVRQFLLAGSTGDGWEMDLEQLLALVRLTGRHDLFQGTRFLVGALRPTTDGVIEWARAIESAVEELDVPAGAYCGLAICPPVDANASQADILHHYQRILPETRSEIAVYQLPQITHCSIEPDTMRELTRNPRITMFKDTSGTDIVALSGFKGPLMVRGAEGNYVDMLQPVGLYDGWLLSTGNAFGSHLRRMLVLLASDHREEALAVSRVLTSIVAELFAAAGKLTFGNPFSNANRAVDHLWAYGAGWVNAPAPLTISGNELPRELLEAASDLVGQFPALPEKGYLG